MSTVTTSDIQSGLHNAVVFTSSAEAKKDAAPLAPSVKPKLKSKASAKVQEPVDGELDDKPLHRVSEVRQQQGVSLRTVARHLKKDMATIRRQEKETTDMTISELADWQRVLEVPLADLLVDSDEPLSRPVMERARLVRVMKTAASIAEKSESDELNRLSRMLVDQLVEMMPELSEVSPWHSVGQRRSLDEVGRIVERRVRDDFFTAYREE